MLFMGGWQTQVQLDNSDGSLDQFYLAVADALGVDTDKQRNEVSLVDIELKLLSPKITAATDAIQKSLAGETLHLPISKQSSMHGRKGNIRSMP